MTKMLHESTGNVFLDLGFPRHEAVVMLLRAKLAEVLRRWIEANSLTQAESAKRLKISQPRVSEIARGRVELHSVDYLFGLCGKAGIKLAVELDFLQGTANVADDVAPPPPAVASVAIKRRTAAAKPRQQRATASTASQRVDKHRVDRVT